MNLQALWNECVEILQREDSFLFGSILPTMSASLDGDGLIVLFSSQFARSMVRRGCEERIREVCAQVRPEWTDVAFEVGRGEVVYRPALSRREEADGARSLAAAASPGVAERAALDNAMSVEMVGLAGSSGGSRKSDRDGSGEVIELEGLNDDQFARMSRAFVERRTREVAPNFTEIGGSDSSRSDSSGRSPGGSSMAGPEGELYKATKLAPEFVFETLVMGPQNRFAYNVGLDLPARMGRRDVNPFVIYGSTGLGKTHLANAIGNLVYRNWPDKRIRLVHAEDYVKDYVVASRSNKIDDFIRSFSDLDLLILDDVQFLSGKVKSMEEFFYIFEKLTKNNRQVILTSDTIPSDIEKMDERLSSRFMSGLSAEIEPPDLDMRRDILRRKAELMAMPLSEEVVFFLADNIRSNVRDLEGALKLLAAHRRYLNSKDELDVSQARRIVSKHLNKNVKRYGIPEIQAVVCRFYHVSQADLVGKSRIAKHVRARHMCMILCRNHTRMSFASIGQDFGKHHSVVLNACKKLEERMLKDEDLRQEFSALTDMISG